MNEGPNPVPSVEFLREIRWSLPQFLQRRLCANPILERLWQAVYFAVFTAASYVLVTNYVFEAVEVVGPSMKPTLQHAEHYMLNRWVYNFREPHVSEIVVIRDPGDDGYSVKRIIAGPGDRVRIHRGTVFVNDRRLVEPYLRPGTMTHPATRARNQLIYCGNEEYVVLGDNRSNSLDSRHYGVVARDRILGVIWN
jgi:signal peptidase I